MVDTSEKVVLFFNNSPKRNKNLQDWIKDVTPEAKRRRLIDTCQTRFVERHDSFEVLCELYHVVERSLSDMAVDRSYNRETNHEANTLHFAITNFQFVVTLVTVKNLMGYTKALSVNLQGRAQDVIHAYNSVNNVILTLNDVRANV